MFGGTGRRIVSIWFPRFPSDRALRARAVEGPFALSLRHGNADGLYCLNPAAEALGLHLGLSLSEARAFAPSLIVRPADLAADRAQLAALRRWALRYCPWVGVAGRDALVLDITGAAHLIGDEAMMQGDIMRRLTRAGFTLRIGIADTHGAARALAHAAPGIAAAGQSRAALADLPIAALLIPPQMDTSLQRLGLRKIGDLLAAPRAPLARRFGQELLDILDRALGDLPDPIMPEAEPPRYGVRMTLPEPIGLLSDVTAGLDRLLIRLCETLRARGMGARSLRLTLRRVDGAAQHVPIRLAAPMREAPRILPLFARALEQVDAGFGIDQLRLEADVVTPMAPLQLGTSAASTDRVEALMTRIGTRIGLENLRRFQPIDSHIPENSFALAPASDAQRQGVWPGRPARPLILFTPEPVAANSATPPAAFHWRRMGFTTARATGPERIAPEWWSTAPKAGVLRDYWRIDTREGRRLWLFYTPQNPGWFVQGEFL
ncbi:Y-family DNA polymerase [Ketogulonicigenium vulgare]|uniref:Y-family DNA polymerase n=1 Tax=Ketogulonicigenium vulgare TaxID=92945 RepID=UPI00235870A0|nr:DNA polymerase Y family protein [Ketogulonicigenium vulgare]